MAKQINPFEHHHPHYHDDEPLEHLDPAQQSLNDALRVSFGVLKFVMIIIVVLYFFSGMTNVGSNEQAVRLRFGEIVSAGDGETLGPGFHFALPFPIEEIIRVPTTQQTMQLDDRYWFAYNDDNERTQTLDELAANAGASRRALSPEKEGSLMTGDKNIVHARWEVAYTITDPSKYVNRIGNLELAEQIVRNVAEQGIVGALATTNADDFIRRPDNIKDKSRNRANDLLADLDTGIAIDYISATSATVPLNVRPAYQAVTGALSEKETSIQQAKKERDEILVTTAGEAWQPLWQIVQDFEVSKTKQDAEAEKASNQALLDALENLKATYEITDEVTGEKTQVTRRISGEVAKTINNAKAYRSQITQQVRSEANEFKQLVAQYNENKQLFMDRQMADMWAELLAGGVEVYYIIDGQQIRLNVSRDPRIVKDRERRREEERRKAAEEAAGE